MTVRARRCKAYFAPTKRASLIEERACREASNWYRSCCVKQTFVARNKCRQEVTAAEGEGSSWEFTSVVVRTGMNSYSKAGAYVDPQRRAAGKRRATLNLLIASSWQRARSV